MDAAHPQKGSCSKCKGKIRNNYIHVCLSSLSVRQVGFLGGWGGVGVAGVGEERWGWGWGGMGACCGREGAVLDFRFVWLVVGALSPVSQRIISGLTTNLVYFLVILSTSHYTTSLFFSNHDSNNVLNFGTQTQKNKSS